MSPYTPGDGPTVISAVRRYYNDWATQMVRQEPALAGQLPSYDDLPGDAAVAWYLAFASTVQTAGHMAQAVMLTTDTTGD